MRQRRASWTLFSALTVFSFLSVFTVTLVLADPGPSASNCTLSPTAKQDPITPLTYAVLAQCHMREVVVIRTELKDFPKKEKEGIEDRYDKREMFKIFPSQNVVSPFYYYTDINQRAQGVRPYISGTGFMVAERGSRGYALTNAHLVENAYNITVFLLGGKSYPAKVIFVSSNPKIDIAILEIEKKDPDDVFSVATLGDSDTILAGESVMSIGHPHNQYFSVHPGHISQIRVDSKEPAIKIIQLKTDPYPGSSGSPTYDHQGRVVAIIFAIEVDEENEQLTTIGWAVAINTVKSFIEKEIPKQ